MIWEHLIGDKGAIHTKEDEPCTKREFTKGRTIFCRACNTDQIFYPKRVYVKCGKCGTGFAYFPIWLNSTKGMDPLPKCPNCGNYKDTRIIGGTHE